MRTIPATLLLLPAVAAQTQPATVEIHATGALAERHIARQAEPQLLVADEGEAQTDPGTLDSITRFAARFVRPRLRAGEEFRSLGKNTIVALARPAQHQWLRQFITINQSVKNYVMKLECRFVSAEPAAWRKTMAPLFTKAAANRSHALLAPGEKTDRYVRALLEQRGVSVLTTQSLTTLPAQRANISILSQTSYWKDYHPEFDATGKLVRVSRLADVVHDGVVLDASAAMVRPGMIGLRIHAVLSDLEKPIRSHEIRFKGLPDKLVLQVPEIDTYEIKTEIEIRDGGTAVFPMPKRNGQRLAVFLTARRIVVN